MCQPRETLAQQCCDGVVHLGRMIADKSSDQTVPIDFATQRVLIDLSRRDSSKEGICLYTF